jgi:hypothetical protein
MRRFCSFLSVPLSRITSLVYIPQIAGKVMFFVPGQKCIFDIGGEQVWSAAAAKTSDTNGE